MTKKKTKLLLYSVCLTVLNQFQDEFLAAKIAYEVLRGVSWLVGFPW